MIQYAFEQISINPDKPYKQAGFIQQVQAIEQLHDDLFCRIAYFETEEIIIHCSLDNLGSPSFMDLKLKIEEFLQIKKKKPVHLLLSCTHTHFAPDGKDQNYLDFLYSLITEKILQLELNQCEKLTCTFEFEPFTGVGNCRLTQSETENIFAETLCLYDQEKRIAVFLIYNCHPTIMNGDTPFFSSEYPGLVIKKLQTLYPKEFITFLQGAAGDVSTRFTRKTQDYQGVEELADRLVNKFKQLLIKKSEQRDVTLSYREKTLTLKHELISLDNLTIPSDITDREKQTIEYGIIVNKKHREHSEDLPKTVTLYCLGFGKYHIVFAKNELFSCYIDALDREHSSLVCYTNGYGPYVTGVDFNFITYESLSGTMSNESKKELMKIIHEFTHNESKKMLIH